MTEPMSTRRQFLGIVGRSAGLVAVAGLGWRLVVNRDGERVWQIDPTLCDGCTELNDKNFTGTSRCSSECVLKRSAVKVVNDFSRCGYCKVCPGYHDVNSPLEDDPDDPRPAADRENAPSDGVPKGRVCPYDALRRKFVGTWSNDNPNRMYFEYVIDEAKCTGCGKCVVQCRKPSQGNGSLRLEVRHNLCVSCNQCGIAKACPIVTQHQRLDYQGAFYRDDAPNRFPGKTLRPIPEFSQADTTKTADLPCGPGPFGRRPSEEHA